MNSSELTLEKVVAKEDLLFPNVSDILDQDEEWCILKGRSGEEKIRFHDYERIFAIPGLYEAIFYDHLQCQSPTVVCSELQKEILRLNKNPQESSALDVGAGNGMVGEELQNMGVNTIVGIDIIEAAKQAALRDRPEVYDDFFVEDLTDLSSETQDTLHEYQFDCMTTVAALGFCDIPPKAFSSAFNMVKDGGLIAMNIRDKFLEEEDTSGFQELLQTMDSEKIIDITSTQNYTHRKNIHGESLKYVAIVGQKTTDISDSLVDAIAANSCVN